MVRPQPCSRRCTVKRSYSRIVNDRPLGQIRSVKWSRLLDLVYPRTCSGCGASLGEDAQHVCWNCRAALRPIAPPHCARCGNPLEGRVDHAYICYHCTQMQPAFDLARSAVR